MARFRAFLLLLLATVAGSAWAQTSPLVVTANPLLDEIVRLLADDAVTTHCLLPAGTRYRDLEPSADDEAVLGRAALLVVNGLELEPDLEPAVNRAGFAGPIVIAAEGLPALNEQGQLLDPETEPDHGQGVPDPFAWHDPRNVRTYVQTIGLALIDLLPHRAAEIAARERAYLQELETAHAYAEEQIGPHAPIHRVLATSHDFLGYLAHAYGLQLLIVPGPGAGLAPDSPGAVRLAEGYRQLGVPAVFVPADAGARTLRSIAQESDVQVIASLAEGPERGQTYLRVFRTNIDTIARAQRQ